MIAVSIKSSQPLFSALNTPNVFLVQIVHEKVYDDMLEGLLKAYKQVKVGNAVEGNTLCGPLHSKLSKTSFEEGIKKIKSQAIFLHLHSLFCRLELLEAKTDCV